MLLIGLTGSIGSGKSLAAKYFAELGCRVVDADQLSRQLTAKGGLALPTIVKVFGGGFLGEDGGLDRAAMRKFVFDRPAAKKKLEEILHPLIIQARAEMIAALEREESDSGEEIVLVSEAALSIEAGLTGDFDHLLLVNAPEALRRERVTARDPHGAAMFEAANATQMSEVEKARHADLCLANDGDEEALRQGVDQALAEMQRRGPLLKQPQAARLLQALLRGHTGVPGPVYAEVFWERRFIAGRYFEDGRLKDQQNGIEAGTGLRVVAAGVTEYRALGSVDFATLLEAAQGFSRSGGTNAAAMPLRLTPKPFGAESPVGAANLRDRVEAELSACDAAARVSKRLRQVSLLTGRAEQQVVIATATLQNGTVSADYCREFRTRHLARPEAVAEDKARSSQSTRSHAVTGAAGALQGPALRALAETAAHAAVERLAARALPPGEWPVLLAAGEGGTIFHEAVGHPLEADLADSGATFLDAALRERKRVAGAAITVEDDGTLPGGFGSSAFDDEGVPARAVPLITRGVVAGVLNSRAEATPDSPPTGNGRRESWRELPLPRMRNTVMRPGSMDLAALLKKLKTGVYVTQLGGGEVDTASGNFMFSALEAFWVENGEVRHPLKALSLAGNALEFLKNIRAIGDDFATAPGWCGKDGQDAPISSGMPSIIVGGLTLSG